MKLFSLSIFNVVVLSLLMGCGSTPVASEISQREANRIVAILHQNGISAELQTARGRTGRYIVLVSDAAFSDAATILSKRGLPSEKQPSFEEMTAANGIIPTSREVDNLRLDRALAAELEVLLSMNSSVHNVGAIVRLHSVRSQRDSSISVALELESKSSISNEELKEIVERAFPAVDPNRIYITVSRIDAEFEGYNDKDGMVPFLLLGSVSSSLYSRLVSLFLGIVLFAGLVFGSAGYLIGQYLSIRRIGSIRSRARTAPRSVQNRSGLDAYEDEDHDGSRT